MASELAVEHIAMKIDLRGKRFDINQDFIDKYPGSMLAKSLMVKNGKERSEPIKINRSGKYFSKILEYARGKKKAINLSQMSHKEIKELIDDLKFFGLDDELLERCESELDNIFQESINIAASEKHLKESLLDETRLVIILNSKILALDSVQLVLMRAMKLVDRDMCLIVGCRGELEGFDYIREDKLTRIKHKHNLDSFLCDPVSWKMLQANADTTAADIFQMIYQANTRPSHIMYRKLLTRQYPDSEVEAFDNRLYVSSRNVDVRNNRLLY